MRLVPVTGRIILVVCARCCRLVFAGTGYSTQGDLDGEPFRAYYCAACVEELGRSLTEEDFLIFRARTTVAQMGAYLKADRASAGILHGFALDASYGNSQPKLWAWLTWSAYERAHDAGEI